MQVHLIQHTDLQKKNTAPNFQGAGDAFLRFLATNQGVGANLTDLSFMVIPRTLSDAKRGPAATLETARREASGTANHSLIGAYGLASGLLLATIMGVDSKYGTKVNSMFTAPETLNILAENRAKQLEQGVEQIEFIKETLRNLKGFNPNAKNADKEGFVKLSEETIDNVAKIIDNAILDQKLSYKEWAKKGKSNSFEVVVNEIIASTGAEAKYILESTDKKTISKTNLKTFLEDLFKVSKTFNKESVKEAFAEQISKGKGIGENAYIKKLSRFFKSRSIAGFAIGTAIGMSIQPINIYLTKLKTGSDGFVGVEGRQKDDSNGFKAMKLGAAGAFLGMTMATLQTGFKGFMEKMAFKGFWPTLNQLKGIYGLTIISRLLAARDKDELRESLTKDTLGFLSWLVLGDFVNKMTAEGLDSSVMNRTKDVAGKNFFSRVFHSTLKSRDEILIKTLSENGIDVVKKDGDKLIAKTFKELMEELNKLPEHIQKATKKRLGTLNKAQLAGYAFSGLVLGIGIPNLNIYLTNKLDKKRKEKALQETTNK